MYSLIVYIILKKLFIIISFVEQDPLLGTPPPVEGGDGMSSIGSWGPIPPSLSTLEELCPVMPPCPTCPRCSDPALSITDLVDHLRIEPLAGKTYKGLPPRATGT